MHQTCTIFKGLTGCKEANESIGVTLRTIINCREPLLRTYTPTGDDPQFFLLATARIIDSSESFVTRLSEVEIFSRRRELPSVAAAGNTLPGRRPRSLLNIEQHDYVIDALALQSESICQYTNLPEAVFSV